MILFVNVNLFPKWLLFFAQRPHLFLRRPLRVLKMATQLLNRAAPLSSMAIRRSRTIMYTSSSAHKCEPTLVEKLIDDAISAAAEFADGLESLLRNPNEGQQLQPIPIPIPLEQNHQHHEPPRREWHPPSIGSSE